MEVMKMYKNKKPGTTSISSNKAKTGEYIEAKVRRILNNKEPIKDGAPRLFTERKDGVIPEYDIRTDKWESAVEATSKISQSHIDKREERQGERTWDTMSNEDRAAFKAKFPNNKLSQSEGESKA